ncbi:MAG: HAMP domain-containing histidine kinase [Patescibacteria group bacterium]|nr:HAMP domain-containing histidine kinase [Patescibacteria group bacterium]
MNPESSQSKFLADAAHEFQTPLAILRMSLETLPTGRTMRERRARQVMEATLDRLSRLVNGLLLAARLNHAENSLARDELDLLRLVGETCEDCLILAQNKGIALTYPDHTPSRPDASSSLLISGDRDRLKETFLNLLSNAFKHTPPGGRVSIDVKTNGRMAEISVADTGSGISRDNLPNIFERFYRINDGAHPGIGIGLHLSKQIIEAHGGTIIAESEPGQGARFTVRLPLARGISEGVLRAERRPQSESAKAVLQ